MTESPTVNPVTPGPTSTTTPAPSAPSSPPPGYMPKATNTSRKFTPTAATATRTCPAARSTEPAGTTTTSSKVPSPPAANRHPPAGNSKTAPALTGASRAACATPERTTTCGSPQRMTSRISIEPSESTKITRPGCSACADRTNPHTVALAKSVTSSAAEPTAPRVSTTRTPDLFSANHDCTAPSASWAPACTDPTTPSVAELGSHTT